MGKLASLELEDSGLKLSIGIFEPMGHSIELVFHFLIFMNEFTDCTFHIEKASVVGSIPDVYC